MAKPNLGKLYTNLAARERLAQVDVQAYTKLGSKAFKVVAATYGINGADEFAEAVVAMTEGQGRMVPNSFRQKGRICVATVMANAKSQPMDAGFIAVTASTARDASGNIWSVVDDGGSKRVVLESADDLADILKSRQAGRRVFAQPMEAAGIATASVRNGDLVRYVDVATGTTSWGLAFRVEGGLKIVNDDLTPKSATVDAVVASVPRSGLEDLPVETEVAALSPSQLDTVLNYLQKAWAKTPVANDMLAKYRKMAEKAA